MNKEISQRITSLQNRVKNFAIDSAEYDELKQELLDLTIEDLFGSKGFQLSKKLSVHNNGPKDLRKKMIDMIDSKIGDLTQKVKFYGKSTETTESLNTLKDLKRDLRHS